MAEVSDAAQRNREQLLEVARSLAARMEFSEHTPCSSPVQSLGRTNPPLPRRLRIDILFVCCISIALLCSSAYIYYLKQPRAFDNSGEAIENLMQNISSQNEMIQNQSRIIQSLNQKIGNRSGIIHSQSETILEYKRSIENLTQDIGNPSETSQNKHETILILNQTITNLTQENGNQSEIIQNQHETILRLNQTIANLTNQSDMQSGMIQNQKMVIQRLSPTNEEHVCGTCQVRDLIGVWTCLPNGDGWRFKLSSHSYEEGEIVLTDDHNKNTTFNRAGDWWRGVLGHFTRLQLSESRRLLLQQAVDFSGNVENVPPKSWIDSSKSCSRANAPI